MKSILKSILATLTCASIIGISACSSDDDNGTETNSTQDTTTPAPAPTTTLFSEAANGDITGDLNNPLPLQLQVGGNIVSGTSIAGDVEYVTINVPAGTELSAITLNNYVSTDLTMFGAIQSGSVFTESTTETNVANLLGYAHFGANDIDSNLLTLMEAGEGAQGFTGSLEDGDYTLWIQQTGAVASEWEIELTVEEI